MKNNLDNLVDYWNVELLDFEKFNSRILGPSDCWTKDCLLNSQTIGNIGILGYKTIMLLMGFTLLGY